MNNNSDKITSKDKLQERYKELEKKRSEMSEEEFGKQIEKIDVDDLVEEFMPLLKDFFMGEFINLHNMILCTFYNGEKFKISIEKVEE